MSKVSNWFKVHQAQLLQHLEREKPQLQAFHDMVTQILFIAHISANTTVSSLYLEGWTTALLSAQCQGLLCLHSNFVHLFQAVGPLKGNANVNENVCALSDDRKFTASFVSIASAFKDIGMFAVEALNAIDVVEKNQLKQNVSKCVVNLIAGIVRVVTEKRKIQCMKLPMRSCQYYHTCI